MFFLWAAERRFTALEAALMRIELKIDKLLLNDGLEFRRWEKQMAWMDDLTAVVAEQASVVAGVKAAFDALTARLDEELAKDDVDLVKVREISDAIKANTATIAAAITSGTAAEGEPETSVTGDHLEPVYPEDPGFVEGTVGPDVVVEEPAAEEPKTE